MAKPRKIILTSGTAANFATAVANLGDAPSASAVDGCARFHGFKHNFLTSTRDSSARRSAEHVSINYVFPDGSQAAVEADKLAKEARVFHLIAPPLKKWNRNKATGLSYTRSDDERSAMGTAYKKWLCADRGWTTETEKCPKCHGAKTVMPTTDEMSSSRLRTWKKNRAKEGLPNYFTLEEKIECPRCDGEGEVPNKSGKTEPDIRRAESYIEEQRSRLETIAQDAVDTIKAKLVAAGFRPVVAGLPATVELWDQRQAAHDALKVELDAAYAEHQAWGEAQDALYDSLDAQGQCDYINNDHQERYQTRRAFEERENQIRYKMHGWSPSWGFYYKPGDNRVLWVGTTNARRYYDAPAATTSLVVKPGSAPSDAELDSMIAEAVAEFEPMRLVA